MGEASDDIKLTPGSVIEISRLPGYTLQTKGNITKSIGKYLSINYFGINYYNFGPTLLMDLPFLCQFHMHDHNYNFQLSICITKITIFNFLSYKY